MMVLCHEKGDTSMTYQQCREMSSQIARYFLQKGYKKVVKWNCMKRAKYHSSHDNLNK